jgi:hypothetical protein
MLIAGRSGWGSFGRPAAFQRVMPHPAAERETSRARRTAYKSQAHEQDDCADRCGDQPPEKTRSRNVQQPEEEAAKQRAYHADDEVTYEPKSAALCELAGQPTSRQSDQRKPQEIFHSDPPFSRPSQSIRDLAATIAQG